MKISPITYEPESLLTKGRAYLGEESLSFGRYAPPLLVDLIYLDSGIMLNIELYTEKANEILLKNKISTTINLQTKLSQTINLYHTIVL